MKLLTAKATNRWRTLLGQMNGRVDASCRHIGPGKNEHDCRDTTGDKVHQANDVEEYRQFKQVHVVPVRYRDVPRHFGGFAELEVPYPDQPCPDRSNATKRHDREDSEGEEGQRPSGQKSVLDASVARTPHFAPGILLGGANCQWWLQDGGLRHHSATANE